jgi:hypothetical protein
MTATQYCPISRGWVDLSQRLHLAFSDLRTDGLGGRGRILKLFELYFQIASVPENNLVQVYWFSESLGLNLGAVLDK